MLHETLKSEFDRAHRYELPLALLIVDIDNFKTINDTHGHMKGDEVLRMVAQKMYASVRKLDTICRYSGEEFVINMPNTDAKAAQFISQRLLSEVETSDFDGIKVTITAGLCGVPQHEFVSANEFFDAADLALYHAKENGRNQVVVYSPDIR